MKDEHQTITAGLGFLLGLAITSLLKGDHLERGCGCDRKPALFPVPASGVAETPSRFARARNVTPGNLPAGLAAKQGNTLSGFEFDQPLDPLDGGGPKDGGGVGIDCSAGNTIHPCITCAGVLNHRGRPACHCYWRVGCGTTWNV